MGHDIFVYGCDGEPIEDWEGEAVVLNGHQVAYARFGCGCPLRHLWYQAFEATEYDSCGISGIGGSKIFGRLEFKAYSAHHHRLKPPWDRKITEWLRRVGAEAHECQWLVDQVDEAMTSIQNFFAARQPQISSGVALYLSSSNFPPEVTRIIASFAADDEARIFMYFG